MPTSTQNLFIVCTIAVGRYIKALANTGLYSTTKLQIKEAIKSVGQILNRGVGLYVAAWRQ